MLVRSLLVLTFTTSALAGCESRSSTAAAQPAAAIEPAGGQAAPAPIASLTRIEDASQVCMVNNQFMGKAQIPVEVGGKTYYGCCAMCKDRLEKDAAARTATDPVTGEAVDKSVAVMARDASGAVHYFANANNLASYGRTM